MSNYLRNYVEGGWYFFTLLTWKRERFLTNPIARDALKFAIQKVQSNHPFENFAISLMPEHLHCVWKLPENDNDYSVRWQLIKSYFTRRFLSLGGKEKVPSESMKKHSQRGIWQKRFWEHTIRNETDLKRCVDYIHYNPIKHGLVENPGDYEWSTYGKFVKLGEYDDNWGDNDPCPNWDDPE